MKTTNTIITVLLAILLVVNIVSAVTVNSVFVEPLSPGQTGRIELEVENTLNDQVEDFSIMLDFKDLPFTPVGSSEDSINELDEGDEEDFSFNLKAANDIVPGDYQIPYTIIYKINDDEKTRHGSIGVSVKANSDLSFSISQEGQVMNQEGTINFKIVNKGFGDAKFVSVKIIQDQHYTLLSEEEVYVGTIDSDDFETVAFDVVYKDKSPIFTAIVSYKDFDNKLISKTVNLPMKVYTIEEAIQLGIIQRNNIPLYIGIVVALILAWIIYRMIRKRIRRSKNKQARW